MVLIDRVTRGKKNLLITWVLEIVCCNCRQQRPVIGLKMADASGVIESRSHDCRGLLMVAIFGIFVTLNNHHMYLEDTCKWLRKNGSIQYMDGSIFLHNMTRLSLKVGSNASIFQSTSFYQKQRLGKQIQHIKQNWQENMQQNGMQSSSK